MLSFAYKWLDDSKVSVRSLPHYPGYKKDPKNDRMLAKELHELLSRCDIAVAHNGDAFDLKKARARFLYHGFKPTPPIKSVDTLKILRKHFNLTSNKLDAACGVLGLGRKLPNTGKDLWFRCMAGDPTAFKALERYNAHDVTLLCRLYDHIAKWATNLPDINLYTGGHGCPHCGSEDGRKHGYSYARSVVRQRYQCRNCDKWYAGEKMNLNNWSNTDTKKSSGKIIMLMAHGSPNRTTNPRSAIPGAGSGKKTRRA